MKKLLSIVFTVALLMACNQSAKETMAIAKDSGWATSHLKGMVQTIEETSYTADDAGKIGEMDSCCVERRVYNDKGYSVSYSEIDNQGNVTMERKIERLEDGKFKSAKTTENGKLVRTRTTSYDADGKAKHAIDTDSTGQISFFYNDITENELGQALEGKMYSADSSYMGTWSRKYTDGMRTGTGWIDSSGVVKNDYNGELNEKGWMGKMTVVKTDKDGTTTELRTYTYDSFDEVGNWTQKTIFKDGKMDEVEKRKYTYFKEG